MVDGQAAKIDTQAKKVAEVLADAGVELDENDVVTPGADEAVDAGMTIVVRHSVPIVLELGGERVPMDVVGETVADALIAAGIDPSANPAVTPPLTAKLAPEMTVSVPDVFVRVVQEESEVPASIRKRKDASLPEGARRVVKEGRPGKVLRVYRVVVAGGVETEPVLTAERIVTRPQARVIALGTGTNEASRAVTVSSAAAAVRHTKIPHKPEGGRSMRVLATGYSPQQPDLSSTTATGARARRGVIAVDPSVIPLGTRVYVPGYGYAVAADTGGAIRGAHIDLCFDTVGEARAWGRRTVTIVILP